jgi:hypothetical protein
MQLKTSSFLFSMFSMVAVGCVGGDDLANEPVDEEEPVVEPPVVQPLIAETCAEIAATKPSIDGPYTLYVGKDESKPWTAHCKDMAGLPVEYLTLKQGAGLNFSQYSAGGASPGSDVVTIYRKVRIDPITLAIDINDQTFSISSGQLAHSGAGPVDSMPFGVAMNCFGAPGVANIDLGGTPFVIADPFALGGAGASGLTTLGTDSRSVNLVGEGGCGWNAAEGAQINPFNKSASNFALDLVYSK